MYDRYQSHPDYQYQLALSDLRDAVQKIVMHYEERKIPGHLHAERDMMHELSHVLDSMRFSSCSECGHALEEDDWDRLGNRTDTCEICHDEKELRATRGFFVAQYRKLDTLR